MAEIASTTFSQTDASNTGPLPGLTGATNPNQIDNSIQAMMGAVKREHDWRNYAVTSGGSSNAYTLAYAVAPAAYYTGQRFAFKTSFAVTGAATVNVNTLGAKTIKKLVSGTKTDLASGDIASGDYIDLVYDGTDMVWVNKGVASAPSGALTSSGYTMSTARLIGRTTASTGAPEEISIGSGLSMSAGSLSATGGSAVVSCVLQTFTSSGTWTWTKPSGLLFAIVMQQAPGGGGGGSAPSGGYSAAAGSGAGGGYCEKLYMASALSATETVTIGSPSTGGSAGNNPGTAGGNSTFKGMTSNGGGFGNGQTSTTLTSPAIGGTASGGDINVSGGNALAVTVAGANIFPSTMGGVSHFGQPSQQATSGNTGGTSGTGYGQGGRGGFSSTADAAGAKGGDGITYIYEFKSV